MGFVPPDQQPIARTIGRRIRPPVGTPPSPEARAALDTWANRRTRAPKGVFRYRSHDEMLRDRERWRVQALVDAQPAIDHGG